MANEKVCGFQLCIYNAAMGSEPFRIGFIYVSWSTSELRVGLARRKTGLSPPVKYFTDRSKAVLLLWIFYGFFFCLAFVMPLCASVYMCLVVTCWERADLLALVCGVLL